MKEMRDALQDYLGKIVEEESEEEKKNDKKIKTYIIESNITDPRRISKYPSNAQIKSTEDKNLFLIDIPHQLGHQTIYLDSSDPRFWLLHTGSASGEVHDFIFKLVTENKSQLDYSWFSSNFLENKCGIGTGEGFGLKYENSFLKDSEELENGHLRKFSMLFWGGKPTEVLDGLKTNENLVSGVSLSRIKRIFKTEDGFVKESVSREGKFTLTKGDSINSHFLAVDKIKTKYADIISRIENDYRINYTPTEVGFKINGTYALIELKKPIEDLALFVERLLSCTHPFRVFGIPEFIDKDFVKISAVDLHTYDRFNMEISSNFIRIFLYKKSCGNVLTRLMTNLQQYYDSQIKLTGCDDEQLL